MLHIHINVRRLPRNLKKKTLNVEFSFYVTLKCLAYIIIISRKWILG